MVCYFAHKDSVLKAETDQLFGNLEYATASLAFELNLNRLKCNEKNVSRFIHSQQDSLAIYKGKLITSYINPNEPGTKNYQTEGNIYLGGNSLFVEGTATLSHISNVEYYYGILSCRMILEVSDIGLQAIFPNSLGTVHVEINLGVFTSK